MYFLAGRPGTNEVWAAVQRVPDSLLVRSVDRGETWALVGRLPDPVASLVFDETGTRGRLATLFGTVSHSDAPETSWADAPAPAPGFGCLTRGPIAGNDALYACADAYQGAPLRLDRPTTSAAPRRPGCRFPCLLPRHGLCGRVSGTDARRDV